MFFNQDLLIKIYIFLICIGLFIFINNTELYCYNFLMA